MLLHICWMCKWATVCEHVCHANFRKVLICQYCVYSFKFKWPKNQLMQVHKSDPNVIPAKFK